MGTLQEAGIRQSGLAAGETASDCKGREGESARSFSLRSVGSPAASVVPAINGGRSNSGVKSRQAAMPTMLRRCSNYLTTRGTTSSR
jgi:hypothetical protein